jgi:XRE family aerobic/anaerobic benzoate catabolism transcriptional regulator
MHLIKSKIGNILLIMSELLRDLGMRIRVTRTERGLTLRALSGAADLSLRFVSDVEKGRCNISITRLERLASALGVGLARLIAGAELELPARVEGVARQLALLPPQSFTEVCEWVEREVERGGDRVGVVALLGVRGAGKSTVGRGVAARLGVEFVELDRLIEEASGLSLGEIFSIHGEDYYRRVEYQSLKDFLGLKRPAVMATGGSLVTHDESFDLLYERCRTVWLSAHAQDHWDRVLAQGDDRPMRRNPQAFAQLEQLLAERRPLYGRAHDRVDTSGKEVPAVVGEILGLLGQSS